MWKSSINKMLLVMTNEDMGFILDRANRNLISKKRINMLIIWKIDDVIMETNDVLSRFIIEIRLDIHGKKEPITKNKEQK